MLSSTRFLITAVVMLDFAIVVPSWALPPPVTSGLVLQLDGNHVTTAGTTVTSMVDQSGLGHDAIDVSGTYSGAAYAPVLSGNTTPGGIPTLTFSSTGMTLLEVAGSTDFDAVGLTWYVVLKANAGLNSGRSLAFAYSDIDPTENVRPSYDACGTWVLTTNATTNYYIRTNARHGDGTTSATANTPAQSLNTTDYFITGGTWDTLGGGYSAILIDKLNNLVTASRTGSYAGLSGSHFIRIGATGAYNGASEPPLAYFDGEIAGALIYNRVLDADELTAVQGYLYGMYFRHPGDANGDGMVNLSDLQILGDNWQASGALWAEADFTGDGFVNLADLQVLGDNWGYGTSPDVALDEALVQAGIVIPEPAALSLLGVGALYLTRRRK